MPTYEYQCDRCAKQTESLLSVNDRDLPCKSLCSCGGKISRDYRSSPAAAVDMTLTPSNDFKKIMEKMKTGVPSRFRENLSQASDRKGTVWGCG
jgi:putative FmdB family regulatory protein